MDSIKSFFIKRTTIIAMVSTIVFGLAVHFYKFVNHLPNWDSMYLIKTNLKGMSHTGRWFSGISSNLVSSGYSLPWVTGLLSLVFLALVMALLVDLFEIKRPTYIVLSAILLVTFPSVTATFTYMEWADVYFLSLLLSVLSVYLCIRGNNKTILISALLISFSMGIYQIYFSTAIVCFLIYIFKKYILENEDFRSLWKITYKFGISLIIGVVIYFVLNKLNLAYWKVEMSNYQGVDSVGLMSMKEYIEGFKETLTSFGSFFLGEKEISIYLILSILFLIVFAVLSLIVLFMVGNNIYKLVGFILFFIAYFVFSHIYYFASPGVHYHTLMVINIYFIYLLAIIMLSSIKIKFPKLLVYANITVLALLAYYHFINTNVAYEQMQMSYEKSYFTATEIMNKVDSINNGSTHDIFVFGRTQSENDNIDALPEIAGASSNIFLQFEDHYQRFFNYYLNRQYDIADDKKKAEIKRTGEFRKMNAYPYGEYVKVIDDTIVVRLSK